ncbi:glycosyltransferase family 2 protein [Aurantimonas litoralis]|mgnify:CR=1 FL=1|nr:glycosyltransferase family 2 protein [Aurantimonas litoralis]
MTRRAKKVSVVIPSYNRPSDTAVAICSALAQDGVEVEVLVVDDGSVPPLELPTDLAREPRVRLLRAPANGGAAAARNIGIEAARHDWIAFLDSDDEFLPGKLAAQLDLADPSLPLQVVVCGFRYHRLETGSTKDLVPIPARGLQDFSSGCWFCPGSTALTHWSAFTVVGMLDERLRRLEDVDWFLRLGKAGGGIVASPICGALINVGKNAAPDLVDGAAALMLAEHHDLPASARRRLEAYLALEQAAARAKRREWLPALSAAFRSFRAVPRRTLHLRRWWSTGAEGQ